MDTNQRYVPLGYAQITDLSTAKNLPNVGDPAAIPPGATLAIIIPEAQAVRWRDDGTAPTSSVGMTLAVGVPFEYSGTLSAIEFIQATSGAILNVTYYKLAG